VALQHAPPFAPPVTLDQQIMLAAADPRINIAKMKELTELRRQMMLEQAEDTFKVALHAAQTEMRPIEADAANSQTHSKYATLYKVDKVLRPIYSKHGLSVSFNTADCPLPNHTRVLAYVERGLFTRTYQYDVAVDTKGPQGGDVMTKTHAGGSALSYGKRYLLLMIFNVTIGDPGRPADDDGNAAAGLEPVNPAQLKFLIELADTAGADKVKFCTLMKVESMASIPASRFDEAKQQLDRKLLAKQKWERAARGI
jgi:ERF superfamily